MTSPDFLSDLHHPDFPVKISVSGKNCGFFLSNIHRKLLYAYKEKWQTLDASDLKSLWIVVRSEVDTAKMLDVFLALKAALKINSVNIDNFIFSLHYKFTFLFLVAASVLVTCKQYIGDPIDCIHNAGSNYPNNVMVMQFR
jgi:Innexin